MKTLIAPTVTVLSAVLVKTDSQEMEPFVKISMSAPRIPIRVMKTLIAPTLTVLTAVTANKDSLEMAEHVKQ